MGDGKDNGKRALGPHAEVVREERGSALGVGTGHVEGRVEPILQPCCRHGAEHDNHDPTDDHDVSVAEDKSCPARRHAASLT
jgi:hypothetical protein